MPIIVPSTRRVRELYVITVKHRASTSVVELPEGTDAHTAAEHLKRLVESHKPVIDSPIADMGQPQYRLWRLAGSTNKDDTEGI